MSLEAMTAVLKHSKTKYGSRLTLIAMANHANECGECVFRNEETLAKAANLSVRQVVRSIQICENLSEVAVERRTNKPNRYHILLPGLLEEWEAQHAPGAREKLTQVSTNYSSSLRERPSRDIYDNGQVREGDNMSPQSESCESCGAFLHPDGFCPGCGLIWKDGKSNMVETA